MPKRAGRRDGIAALSGRLVVLGLVLTTALTARASIVWTSTASVETAVVPPPVILQEGSAAANSRWFKDLTITPNETAFTGDLKAKSGALAHINDVIRVHNRDDSGQTVTFTANQVSNPNYEVFQWTVRDGATVVTTFDYTATSPSASFAIAAGVTYQLDLTVDLSDGAGKNNAAVPFGLAIQVS